MPRSKPQNSLAIEEENVIWVNGADCVLEPSHDRLDKLPSGLSWFVHDVVSCNPSMVLVVLSQVFPNDNGSILEILVDPEQGLIGGIVGVPVYILASW